MTSSAGASARAYDLAILDFDGVLADSAPWMLRNLSAFNQRHGLPALREADIERLRGVPNRQIVRELRVPFWKLPAIARDFRAVMAEHAHEIALFDGVAGFLEAMQAAGVKVAIVSSNSEANIRRILGEENAARVTCYVCAASLFGKARLFRTAVRKTGVTRGRALCVGDETRDIEAARQAGLRCAAVSWGYATRQVLADARPDHLVDSFEELVRLLAR